MTKEEILKGNKLIVEFMGYTKEQYTIEKSSKEYDVWTNSLICKGCYYDLFDLKYHSSWDWLMPVVEKIGSSDLSTIDIHWGTGCTDSFAWCDILWNSGKRKFKTSENLNSDEQSLIKSVWAAVIEFIKWYNKEK